MAGQQTDKARLRGMLTAHRRRHGLPATVRLAALAIMRKKLREAIGAAFPDGYVKVLTTDTGLKVLVLDEGFAGLDAYERVSRILKPLRNAVNRGTLSETNLGLILSVDAYTPLELT